MSILDDVRELQGDLVQLRRSLHTEPELGLHLPRTQEKVLTALDGLPLETTLGASLSSVTAVLRGGMPGPTVLLRADMDALPLTEQTRLDYRSTNPDAMHACGHDLHTAMLVGAAQALAAHRDRLSGDVVFMFQPGEEGHDGAGLMIREGVLEASGNRPVAAYGLHVSASMQAQGSFATRSGPVLAASHAVRVIVHGRGGHGSMPHRAQDPVPAACEMVTALQTFVTRTFDPFDPVVLTVGRFVAGTANNVIPDTAEFGVTIRSFSRDNQRLVKEGFLRTCTGIAQAHGLEVEIEYADQYPVTVNDAGEAEFVAEVVADLHGEHRFTWSPQPATGSEDFSRVLDEIPGAFTFLGACPAGVDAATAAPNHSARAEFDDAVLADGAAILGELTLRRLARTA
ncbi:amidohydrolase [Rhodococcus sp. D2-41]|uniref:M20 metallopeptidase family protein n=1 Tax=Speluncibacter jeojiensis TaxID=2710754 RepID=UPI00240EFBAB|nr:M20 family metallopeptidase [Rhodococcus sp. D2-41]MDG3009624.1 amidohydrolase [Rhodococcus sp. D2-41]